jgi:hypothetical protein
MQKLRLQTVNLRINPLGSRHVEDVKNWIEKRTFRWFMLQNYITINGAKNMKYRENIPCYRPAHAVIAPGGWGSQTSRQSAQGDAKVVRSTHRPPLSPRKYFLSSFMLEAESTPEPQCGRNRTRDLPACNAVPQPTVPPPLGGNGRKYRMGLLCITKVSLKVFILTVRMMKTQHWQFRWHMKHEVHVSIKKETDSYTMWRGGHVCFLLRSVTIRHQ